MPSSLTVCPSVNPNDGETTTPGTSWAWATPETPNRSMSTEPAVTRAARSRRVMGSPAARRVRFFLLLVVRRVPVSPVPSARGSGPTRRVLARDKGDLGGAMRLRTKALAVAAGAVPLLFGGTTPAEASEAVSATQTFTFERSRSSVTCTFTGTSQVEYFAESDAPTAILARTLLVDDHNDPNCRSLGYAFVEVAFKRDGASTFEYAYSVSDDFDANVGLRLEGAIVDVVVRHGASYDCDASRPCTGTFITNPK
jgi:hypothetical protein